MRRFIAAMLLVAPDAYSARPFVTDDARTVDVGGCQIETFVKRQRKFDENEFWFLPACNPWGAELTAGHISVNSTPNGDTGTTVLQAKMLLKPLATNGAGFGLSVGTLVGSAVSPYINGIGSFSFADDRVVLHTNLGAIQDNARAGDLQRLRGTWGVGAEVLLAAPRLYGIFESYGMRGEKPTLHTGLRIWIVPNRVQIDTTVGRERSTPERQFGTVGLRLLW
jgi:hypothetical protein